MIRLHAVVCFYCHEGEQGHDRATGACYAFRRAEYPPVVYRARSQVAATGWRVR